MVVSYDLPARLLAWPFLIKIKPTKDEMGGKFL